MCVYMCLMAIFNSERSRGVHFASHRSSEVDGHQRVGGQEEVIKSQGVFELRQHVAKPRYEP